MSDAPNPTQPNPAPTVPARHWPAETIEAAYQVWSGSANRNQSETIRQLAAMGYGGIPPSTLNQWVKAGGWRDRAAAETVAGTRIHSERYVEAVWVAAFPAIQLLASVSRGTDPEAGSPIPLETRLKAATDIANRAQALLLAQAKASGAGAKRVHRTASVTIPDDPDALAQLERERRQQRG